MTSFSPDLIDLGDFLWAHRFEIVRLDVHAELLAGEDLFPPEPGRRNHLFFFWTECFSPGAETSPSVSECVGYQLALNEERDGTSGFSWTRGSEYHLSGYFAVGDLVGPHQGIITQALDPVAAEEALP